MNDAKSPPAALDPAAAGWEHHADAGFLGLVGPIWEQPAGDSFRYAFLAEAKHHNRRGVVQGGMLMTFADRAMGRTCWYANEQQPQATVQLDEPLDRAEVITEVQVAGRLHAGEHQMLERHDPYP